MAGASLDWPDKPNADVALPSDEEDLISSPSTASRELEGAAKQNMTLALGKRRVEQEGLYQSSEQDATPTLPRTEGPNQALSEQQMDSNPLQLLDLPLDILKEIIKEVTHTTDLTSLALTCSALHSLAIPHMYSRFDIVWPESLNPSTDDYSGVDALSYGLSTLVMCEDVFNRLPRFSSDQVKYSCLNCGCGNLHQPDPNPKGSGVRFQSRRGNNYAQYTRTFSIGNGPLSWVQEYSVTKEVGKMLGTLVALAVARMVNLEAFIWDMPTGVVREIWLALASLADRPGHDCRLERVWVRWHDNSENALRSSSAVATRLFQKYKHVEHPSLSVLPPLKSVAVLDIDEPAYVEELELLIDRSRHRLSELRIGIAEKAHMSAWLLCRKESEGSTSWPRADGVLGILMRRNLDNKQDNTVIASPEDKSLSSESPISKSPTSAKSIVSLTTNGEQQSSNTTKDKKSPPSSSLPNRSARSSLPSYKSDSEILHLKVLELERIPLSLPTLLPAIDWTGVTTLTIMRCEDHEKLWRALRRKYAPPTMPTKRPRDAEHRASASSAEYSLNLKQIRTDTVSPYLMLFIKDALAPNTLESVYLHEAPGHESAVQIDAIYRHILRKHRQSLQQVLIDATDRIIGTGYSGTRWHKWIFNHDMVSFVTSGKMPQLKELGMAMHYSDWHFFLQRLPNMPQLRALYLSHIRHVVHRDLKELALQVLDIVSIRPELKIAYIGLHVKCYQILEARHDDNPLDFDDHPAIDPSPTHSEDEDEGWANPNHASDEDSDDSNEDGSGAADTELISSDLDDYDTEPDEEQSASRIRYRLQEILFYDEKVSIFKARHGVL